MTLAETTPRAAAASRTPMSEVDFETWVLRDGVRAEWVEGAVVEMSPANVDHWDIVHWLVTLMRLHASKHGLGVVGGTDFMTRMEGRRRLPDIFFVAESRRSIFKRTYLDGSPDLIIEVVSPDSVSRDWREKYIEYEANGVQEYWVVDPNVRHAEFYQLVRGKYEGMALTNDAIHSIALAGFWIKLDWLWQQPLPGEFETAKILGII